MELPCRSKRGRPQEICGSREGGRAAQSEIKELDMHAAALRSMQRENEEAQTELQENNRPQQEGMSARQPLAGFFYYFRAPISEQTRKTICIAHFIPGGSTISCTV